MRNILSAAMLVLLAACSDPTGSGPTDDVRVQTETRSYALHGDLTVPFTATNTTDEEVELLACGGTPVAGLQHRQGLRWVSHTGTVCPANVMMAPIKLAPGASVTGEVHIHEVAGTFRIVLPNPSLDAREPRAISPTFEAHWVLID